MQFGIIVGLAFLCCLLMFGPQPKLRGIDVAQNLAPPIMTVPVQQDDSQVDSESGEVKLDCVCHGKTEKSYPVFKATPDGK